MFGWFWKLFYRDVNINLRVSGEVKINGEGFQVFVVRSEEQGKQEVMSVGRCGSQVEERGDRGCFVEVVSDEVRLQDINKRISGKELPEVKFGKEI